MEISCFIPEDVEHLAQHFPTRLMTKGCYCFRSPAVLLVSVAVAARYHKVVLVLIVIRYEPKLDPIRHGEKVHKWVVLIHYLFAFLKKNSHVGSRPAHKTQGSRNYVIPAVHLGVETSRQNTHFSIRA